MKIDRNRSQTQSGQLAFSFSEDFQNSAYSSLPLTLLTSFSTMPLLGTFSYIYYLSDTLNGFQ